MYLTLCEHRVYLCEFLVTLCMFRWILTYFMHIYADFGEIHAYVCEFGWTSCMCMWTPTYVMHMHVNLSEHDLLSKHNIGNWRQIVNIVGKGSALSEIVKRQILNHYQTCRELMETHQKYRETTSETYQHCRKFVGILTHFLHPPPLT